MGRVRDEPPLRLERTLEPLEEGVDDAGEALELLAAGRNPHPLGQARRVDRAGEPRHFFDRAQSAVQNEGEDRGGAEEADHDDGGKRLVESRERAERRLDRAEDHERGAVPLSAEAQHQTRQTRRFPLYGSTAV